MKKGKSEEEKTTFGGEKNIFSEPGTNTNKIKRAPHKRRANNWRALLLALFKHETKLGHAQDAAQNTSIDQRNYRRPSRLGG